jgi:hypothetical protein
MVNWRTIYLADSSLFFPQIHILFQYLHIFLKIINLVGDPSQQDIELSALFRDAIGNYGEGKVLGKYTYVWVVPFQYDDYE